MKVTVGSETYLMHWETRKFSPKEGKNTGLELEATDCIVRHVMANGDTPEIARGHVSQTTHDSGNSVTARRLSFLKAIGFGGIIPRGVGQEKKLFRELRKALGHEYNRTCRVTSWSHGQKNRKLRKRVKALQERVAELEKSAKKEKALGLV